MALSWAIAGGGTGGHVTPALALGEVVAERGDRVFLIGSDRGLETRLVPAAHFELVALHSRQVMGRSPLARATAVMGILAAALRARKEMKRRDTDIVISVGGYAAMPAALAALLCRIPLAVVEPNAVPGRVNRILARFARRIYTGFEPAAKILDPSYQASAPQEAPSTSSVTEPGGSDIQSKRQDAPPRTRCLGVPLRRSLIDAFAQDTARRPASAPFHLLVFGGSQGARQINDAMIEAADPLAALPLQIFHQAGRADRERVAQAYSAAGVIAEVVEFEPDMPSRYRWADLAICRSGALTVAELALAGLPALLVPYPFAADDHQRANALALESAGAARCLSEPGQETLSGAWVSEVLSGLIEAPSTLAGMSARATELGRPGAAREIVEDCAALIAAPRAGGNRKAVTTTSERR